MALKFSRAELKKMCVMWVKMRNADFLFIWGLLDIRLDMNFLILDVKK